MATRIEQRTQVDVFRWMRSEDWLTFVLVSATILIVVRLVEVVQWVETPFISFMAILGALLGLLTSRSSRKTWQMHLLAILVGVTAAYMQGTGLVEAEALISRFGELNSRLITWLGVLFGNGISPDPVPFALMLSVLAWAGGYIAAWAYFKKGKVWPAILVSTVGLVVTLTYLPNQYLLYVLPYLLVTMLLIARHTSLQRQTYLERHNITYPSSQRRVWMVSALVFGVLLVGLVSLLPTMNTTIESMRTVWNTTRQPAEWFQLEFGRLFSAVENKKNSSSNRFGAIFPIRTSFTTSNNPVLFGSVPFATYWRVRAYTDYTLGGWITGDTIMEDALYVSPEVEEPEEEEGFGVSFRARVASATSYLYIPATSPYSMDIPVQVERHKTAPILLDMVTIRAKNRLELGEFYNGRFEDALYSGATLRAAGQDYPDWVKDLYLGLPTSLPDRVREKALEITSQIDNPYDKARAIETYLRTFEFSTKTPIPAFDDDRVDYFLFETQTGYSDHFSSAMTVMLRAVDIPSRLISGYGPGVPDPDIFAYVVRERDQHSWPEAYFPDVGWVEFEPTPTYPLRPREAQERVALETALQGAAGEGGAGQGSEEADRSQLEEEEAEGFVGGRLSGGFDAFPRPLLYAPSSVSGGGAILVALTALWIGAMWFLGRRFLLTLPSPSLAYNRMRRMSGFFVKSPNTGHTPLEVGNDLASILPTVRNDIMYLCETYSSTLYGHARLPAVETLRVRSAWNRVRKAMLRHSLG